jgi:hypothetical protein
MELNDIRVVLLLGDKHDRLVIDIFEAFPSAETDMLKYI